MSGPPWGAGGWRGAGRPPWWPEGEPFPPTGWRRRTAHRVMPRMAAFAFLAFVAFVVFMSIIVSIVAAIISSITGGAPPAFSLVIGIILLLLILNGGARGFRRLSTPVHELVDAAERIEAGDYSARVRARGPREIRSLSNAFNAMGARLERSETERRRLLADVTHELRTPLAVIQGNIEALIDGVHPADEAHFRAILDETQVLSRLIDDLRIISIAEAGALALHREPTDVAELARDVVASFDAAAGSQGVRLSTQVTMGVTTADIDPIRVREILSNVIANALRYTPRDGSIEVTVTPFDSDISVSVHDTGPGIPPDVLPRVFERFTRSPESPGAGLGLAIAKSLVTAHGGTIIAQSAPGMGTTIRFSVPRAAA
jgi:signal transduction histidine kinase